MEAGVLVKQNASLKNMKSMVQQGLQSGRGLNADFLFPPYSVTMDKSVHLCEPSFPHLGHRGITRVSPRLWHLVGTQYMGPSL